MKTERIVELFDVILVDTINLHNWDIGEALAYLADIGFTKKEAFEFVDKNLLPNDIMWKVDEDEDE